MAQRLPAVFEVEIHALGDRGVGLGTAPDGRPIRVAMCPPGGRVSVVPIGKKRGVWDGRRIDLVRPPPAFARPPCASFGVCGGCSLQELTPAAQRDVKSAHAVHEVATGLGMSEQVLRERVRVHLPVEASAPQGYRNRVEWTFSRRRWVTEADKGTGAPIQGRWLGFHAPGRFDRVVDLSDCTLAGPASNAVLRVARAVLLAPEAPEPWDPRDHSGYLRHLLVRETEDAVLVVLFTAPGASEWPERFYHALSAADLGGKRLLGFSWRENGAVADVATGTVRESWGDTQLVERLGDVSFSLSPEAFFQTSTVGARVLYDVVGAALGAGGGNLLDLYCGVGSIGLYHARRFGAVYGVEENAHAVADAARNARENGIANAQFRVGRVEDALDILQQVEAPRSIVVDPPRAGLHPRAAAALAHAPAEVLVYVACRPSSLGRDAPLLQAGGWVMTDLWTVDLFPHTAHVEAVARFVRVSAG